MRKISLLSLLSFFLLNSIIANAQNRFYNLTEDVNSNKYEGVHSILISEGKQIYEEYFNGFTPDSLHDTRSSFKSITSILLGIAVDKGLINNINEPIYTYFPDEEEFQTDSLKRLITIKDLLEMRSGMDCNEWDGSKDCEADMEISNDWVEYSLRIPMKYPPGKEWAYTSCNPMLIGGIIKRVSNLSVMEFAEKHLFAPLGITNYRWTKDPSGNAMTGGSFYMLPTDMLKIGQLILNDGIWENQQILSKQWIAESTECKIPIPNFSFMEISKSKFAEPQPSFYGYYWYKEDYKSTSLKTPIIFSSGNGGQYIMIIKELDLVVVFTQGNYNSYKAKQAFDILAKYIIKS